ncbi:hypothetical protein D777_00113 [Marinobacter nitratireducens]|uniref:Uncharacterized protein n=1 Tax=Marinobacter nitratireducens TaxID=1137280 RepID=A0A072NJ08_9GAMM|nr:hypothetical protein D777_00113 [Marinobacter nitratireducens]
MITVSVMVIPAVFRLQIFLLEARWQALALIQAFLDTWRIPTPEIAIGSGHSGKAKGNRGNTADQ